MIFEGSVLQQTVAVANEHKIDPASLLAVVEVESAGKSLEMDGVTPCFLFERHVFYRELQKAGKTVQLNNAIAMGLANSTWQPDTQYKDEGTSAKRLALFERAKVVDEECAIRSCSWGVGQTCGFLAEEMHFPNATTMLNYMKAGGVPAQVDCMVREIEAKRLVTKLNAHDWTGFARVYNGPGYARNDYDVKIASAYLKWSSAVLPRPVNPKPVVVPPDVKPKPAPVPVPGKKTGIAAAIAAFFAGVYATVQSTQFRILSFLSFLVILAIVTSIVVAKRRRAAADQQTGVLTTVDGGS